MIDSPVPAPRRCARITSIPPRSRPRATQRLHCYPAPPIGPRPPKVKAISRARRRCRNRPRHSRRTPPPRLRRCPPRTGAVVYRGSASTVSRDVDQRGELCRGMDLYRRSDQECIVLQGAPSGFRSGATEAGYGGVATAWVYPRRRRCRLEVRCRLVSVVSRSFER